MTFYKHFVRLAAGVLSLAVLLFLLFAITIPLIHRWGATGAELGLQLPGDELTPNPLIRWTHAITIDAPPEQVWPWIAQLGDTRGGFYSYTFIENQVGALMGAADYQVVYTNANHIYAAWQYPRPGDPIIQGTLKIREVSPDQYLLADSINPEAMNWIWLWFLQPVNDGQQTRMIVRFAIEVPPEAGENPVMGFFMDIGGFVMEQNMIQGIKLRAEGGSEPAWIEPAEIGLWTAALLAGLVAGVLFILKVKWQKPFFVAAAAVIVLFILTFVQPDLWVRGLLDLALIAGLVWSGLPGKSTTPTGLEGPAAKNILPGESTRP